MKRILPFLIVLALAVAPVALAEQGSDDAPDDPDGSGSSSGSGSSGSGSTATDDRGDDARDDASTATEDRNGSDGPDDDLDETEDDDLDGTDDDSDDRDDRLEACKEQSGDARDDCLVAYCEDPEDDRADDCDRWDEDRQKEDDRAAAAESFSACRASSEGPGSVRECAEEHNEAVRQDDDEARAEREARIEAAKAAHQVGARITLREGIEGLDDGRHIESIDVDVVVETDNATAGTEAADVRITLSAELAEGRTIVLDMDPALLSGPDLVIRYFDLHDDGSETEVVIRQASSLLDILDPTDDAGQPEYWVVSDADGLHVLASVPHWSVHALTVQGLGEFVSEPSILTGIVAGVLGSVSAAAVMFWPRRPDEEA